MKSRIFAVVFLGITLVSCSDPSAPASSSPIPTARYASGTVSNPTATVKLPLSDSGLSVKSDRAFSDGTYSSYANGVCGITATIFLSGSGDMVMDGGNPKYADRKCAYYPRKATVVYPDGSSDLVSGVEMVVSNLETASFFIPVGSSALKHFHVRTSSAKCDGVHWGSVSGGDSVIVTRTAANTWHVTTQAYPNDQAACKLISGTTTTWTVLGHMPVDLWIVSSRNLN